MLSSHWSFLYKSVNLFSLNSNVPVHSLKLLLHRSFIILIDCMLPFRPSNLASISPRVCHSDMLRMRLEFTKWLTSLHLRTLAKHSDMKTPEDEVRAHEVWSEQQAQKAKRHKKEPHPMVCPACSAQPSPRWMLLLLTARS